MKHLRYALTHGLMAVLTLTLAACGGGGSGTNSTSPASMVNGVAATGLAIENGLVSFKCSVGSTSPVSTQADGSFSVDVSQVTLPCVARVDYVDAGTGQREKLHSLVQLVGNVNITPVTDMLVAQLSASGVAADAFDRFDPAEVKGYSRERVQTATQMLKTLLESKGVDTSRLPDDLIASKLVPATRDREGDDHDQVLDDLQEKLAEQRQSLHELEDEMHSGRNSQGLRTSTGLPGDAAAGKTAYDANCLSCHGPRLPDALNAAETLKAIRENEGGMAYLASTITPVTADNIATYLAHGLDSGSGTTLTRQSITFTSPGNQTLGVATPLLQASATSGLPVSLSASTPTVCSVSNRTLNLLAAGTCTLTATQPGNTRYAAAAAVSHSFSVVSAVVADPVVPNPVVPNPVVPNPPVTDPVQPNPPVLTSAANGKTLYASNCASCHGAASANIMNVLAGTSISLLQGLGGMGGLNSMSSQNLADMAAFLATPSI